MKVISYHIHRGDYTRIIQRSGFLKAILEFCQSMSDTGYSMLGAGAWGWPTEMLWGGRWEGGSCLGTHVRIKDFKIKKKKKKESSICLISLLRSYLYTVKFIHWISYGWVLFVYSQNSATITTKVMYISITTKRHSSSIGETPCTAHFSWHNFMSISASSPSCTLDEWNHRMYIASCVLFPPVSIKPSPFIHINQEKWQVK